MTTIRVTIQKSRPTNAMVDSFWYSVNDAASKIGASAHNVLHQVDLCRYYSEWVIRSPFRELTEDDRTKVENNITHRSNYDGIGVQLQGE